MPKICPICSKEHKRPRTLFCSPKCYRQSDGCKKLSKINKEKESYIKYIYEYNHSKKSKENHKKYDHSKNGKEIKKRYSQSEKNKEYRRKYQKSEEGRRVQLKHRRSEKRRIYLKKYYKTNKYKESRRKYWNKPENKFKCFMRNFIKKSISNNGFKKKSHTLDVLGLKTWDEWHDWMESQFDEFMTWENHGTYWHIDHIVPLAYAKTEEETIKLCNHKNLRPLKKEDNLSKGDKLPEDLNERLVILNIKEREK